MNTWNSIGTITAIVEPRIGYQVAEDPNNSATITILDDNAKDVVSILPIESPIVEMEKAKFHIFKPNSVNEDLWINLKVTQFGKYIHDHQPTSVLIPSGKSSVKLEIQTISDSKFQTPGTISVELIDGDGYEINTAPLNTATIKVFDDDGRLGVSIIATETRIHEGETAQFQILTDWSFAEDQEIFYNVITRGEFLSEVVPASIKLDRFKKAAFLNINTQEDGNQNTNGSITVTLNVSENYRVARVPHNSATVYIQDSNIPELSIDLVGSNEIYEGQDIQYRITSSIPMIKNMVAKVSLQYANESQNNSIAKLVILAGETEGILTIATEDDEIDELVETITATLVATTDYLITDSSDHFATVLVNGEELPVVSVETNSTAVTEGESVEFIVSSLSVPKSTFLVNLNISETDNFLINNESIEVELTSELQEDTISVDIVDDFIVEPDNEIVATILTSDAYEIDQNGIAASVTIVDNDQPEISIFAQENTVVEDSTATIEFFATNTSYQGLTINISILETGSFLTEEIPTSVELGSGLTTSELVIQFDDDDVAEVNGKLEIVLIAGVGYSIAQSPLDAASVVIQDNDESSLDSISIAADHELVLESETPSFTLTARQSSESPRIINLTASDSFPFDSQLSTQFQVTFPALTQIHTFAAPHQDDQLFQSNKQVFVQINSGPDYSIAPNASIASITIIDDDSPTGIAIIPTLPTINEGEIASFQIHTDVAISTDRTISIEVTLDEFLLTTPLIENIILPANETWVELTIPTIDDQDFRDDSILMIEILASQLSEPDYEVANTNSSAAILIQDNELSEYSISGDERVNEGDSFNITVHAKTIQPFDRQLILESYESHNVLVSAGDITVVVPAGSDSVAGEIYTQEDSIDEPNSLVTTSIKASDDYRISGSGLVETLVIDDDLVTVSLIADATQIEEGNSVEFEVSLSPSIQEQVNVLLETEGEISVDQALGTYQLGHNESLTLQTERIESYTDNSEIHLTILPGNGYTVPDEPNDKMVVKVVDLDIPEGFSILAAADSIEEGSPAKFKINLNPLPTYPARVFLNLEESGNMLASTKTRTISFIQQSAIEFEVETVDDDVAEVGSTITAYLTADYTQFRDYPISSTAKIATIEVTDNDTPRGVSIYSYHNSVLEGESIKFEIVTSEPFTNSQTIPISISQTGKYLAADLPDEIIFAANEKSVQLKIPSVDDLEYESIGGITVTLESGNNYVLGKSFSSTVAIRDNEIVKGVSIRALKSSIAEGDSAPFLISVSEFFIEDRVINLQISQVGDFLTAGFSETF